MPERLPHDALLVLGAAGDHIPLYQEARRRGIPTIAVDWRPDSPARPYADAFLEVSTRDADAVAAALGDIRLAGIVAGATDAALPTWHALGARYETPYLYPATALAALDKGRFHEIAVSVGLDAYGFVQADVPAEVTEKAAGLRFPVVVKPADGSGSKGVVRVAAPAELPAAVAHARSYSVSGTVIAEEFVEGRPVAVECFMVGGKLRLFAAQDVENVPGAYAIKRMRCPARLSPLAHTRLEKATERLCRALGIKDGPADFDVILDPDDRAYFIEGNPRIGGDSIPQLLSASHGVDNVRALVSLALGEPIDMKPAHTAHAAVELIGSPLGTEGVLVAFEGVAEARAVPGVTHLALYAEPGDLVRPHDQSGHKIGAVVAAGASAEAAETALDAACALLRPVVRPLARHLPAQAGWDRP